MNVARKTLSAMACALVAAIAGAQSAHADALDDFVNAEMEARRIPGLSFAIIRADTVVEERSYGLANIETQTPASGDTVWAIGSITKPMTAILVMMLVEEGAVALDDPIAAHVGDLPKRWRKLTVEQLLGQTSGVVDAFDNPCRHQAQPGSPYSLRDLFAEVSCLPLAAAPGEEFLYANQNYQMLGLLIEAKTGEPYGPVLGDRLFEPLAMASARMLDAVALIPGRANGYEWRGETYVNAEVMDPALESSSGGVLSTVGDIAKFVAAIGDERLLSAKSWEAMETRPTSVIGATPYGLGFGLTPFEGLRRIGHNGAAVGYASAFSWFPDQAAGIVVLSNGYQEPLGRNVQDLAHEIIVRSGALSRD